MRIGNVLHFHLIAKEEIKINNNNNLFSSKKAIRKAISISLALFIMSNILIPSTVASAATLTGSSNTTFGADSNNNNDNIQKQQSQPQPKTHEYTLIARDTTLQIAPGVRVEAWTYNGTIPGPTLTATEGDRVIVHFINKTPLPHTVHLLMISLQNQPVR